ncbi:MAG: ZIP family metal transporter [Bacteroidota bacterium]
MNQFFVTGILFFAPLVGAFVALQLKRDKEDYFKLVLSFSGAFLFSVMLLHLLPEIFQSEGVNAGLYMLLGFFIQVFLEQATHGIEHGHFHHHSENNTFLISLFVGLSVHSFFDGIAATAPITNAEHAPASLLYGIALHKIPEGFALASIFLFSNYTRNKTILVVALFSLIAPVGAMISSYIQENNIHAYPMLLAIVAGSLLHVSTTILFESEKSGMHSFSFKKILTIIFAVALSLLTI